MFFFVALGPGARYIFFKKGEYPVNNETQLKIKNLDDRLIHMWRYL